MIDALFNRDLQNLTTGRQLCNLHHLMAKRVTVIKVWGLLINRYMPNSLFILYQSTLKNISNNQAEKPSSKDQFIDTGRLILK